MKRHFAIFLGLTLSVFGDALFDKTLKEAKNGDASAQFNLGNMYKNGDGVPKDAVEAHVWFNLAGAKGDESAKRMLTLIEKMMTKDQIAEAMKLARERFERLSK